MARGDPVAGRVARRFSANEGKAAEALSAVREGLVAWDLKAPEKKSYRLHWSQDGDLAVCEPRQFARS